MIINIFSDSHLTPFFMKRKYEKLIYIIESCDQIIINGDFWDGFRCNFNKFMNSKWNKLFPLLKEKNTIYLFGNHDPKKFSDDRIYKFCNTATHSHKLEINGYTLHFKHGDDTSLIPDIRIPIIDKTFLNKYVYHFLHLVQLTVFLISRKIYHIFLSAPFELQMKIWQKKHLSEYDFLITGHTHNGKVEHKTNFANSGMNCLGAYEYIQIDTEKPIREAITFKVI